MIEYTGEQQKRNDPCTCGSGLKFKKCHGDPAKLAVVKHIANEAMIIMAAYEKRKQGIINEEEYDEVISNPDFVWPQFIEQFLS